jgi:3-deoxy-7-phosphoheptulonate synthase
MITALGSRETRGNAQVSDIRSAPAACQLVGKTTKAGRSTVWVSGVPVGPGTVTVIAGPCAVESPEQTVRAARMAQAAGASLLRGGAFKPRTSPYAFQGLGEDGLKILAEARAETGLPIVTEVLDAGELDLVTSYADMLQIGARNAQNYTLLRAVGRSGYPVLLKRGMGSKVEEWLLAAEYIAEQGNSDIVLCERGIRTFETATRSTLDIAAIPLAKRQSHLPVIVDPSHSCGRRELVIPLTRAAIAVGADGVMIDVHPDPYDALCDGQQALVTEDLVELAESVKRLAAATGRTVTRHPGTQVATAG